MVEVTTVMQQLLLHPKVRVKDPARLEATLKEIAAGGAEKLQVISDFDHTLTKPHNNGTMCLTTFGIFHMIPQLPAGYLAAWKDLYDHYHPFEIHPGMTVAEKTPYMERWYRDSEQLLVGCEVSAKNLHEQVHKSDTMFRDGSEEMFRALEAAAVPVLVFSAGVGDVVREALQKHGMLRPNVRIISNFLRWEETGGRLAGFQGEITHSLNKNQRAVAAHEEYFSLLAHRPNVLLLGDNEGDAAMGDGLQDPGAMVKVGFLYDRAEERLERFMDLFDIVLLDDQSMDTPTSLLQSVIGHHHFQ